MKIPTNLKHKPVIVSENYGNVDGRRAYASDAQGLSLGLAQWNDRGRVDISAKVWRYTGEKWSRQSEELPMHRVLDLAILICRSLEYFQEAYRYAKLYDPETPAIDRIGPELHPLSKKAKDLGSLAVLLTIFADACIWIGVLLDYFLS